MSRCGRASPACIRSTVLGRANAYAPSARALPVGAAGRDDSPRPAQSVDLRSGAEILPMPDQRTSPLPTLSRSPDLWDLPLRGRRTGGRALPRNAPRSAGPLAVHPWTAPGGEGSPDAGHREADRRADFQRFPPALRRSRPGSPRVRSRRVISHCASRNCCGRLRPPFGPRRARP